jgi:signal transduction histidine kinase
MLAASLQRRLTDAKRPDEAKAASELVNHLNQTLEDARSLSRGLSPVEINRMELADSLTLLVANVQSSSGIPCRISVLGENELSMDNVVAMHLYRIAQEAVNNAVKHAKAKQIEMQLDYKDKGLVLRVGDDGIGLPPESRGMSGLGLRILSGPACCAAAFSTRRNSSRSWGSTCRSDPFDS